MRMYVSAPIFGVENYKESFRIGAELADASGYDPVLPINVVPKEHEGPCPPGRRSEGAAHNDACHMKADIIEMLECEAALFMQGWQHSWGCRTEMSIASLCGLKLFVQEPKGMVIQL